MNSKHQKLRRKSKIVIGISVTLIVAILIALTQQGESQTRPVGNFGPQQNPPMSLFYVDDITKEVVGSNLGHTKEQLASLNTPEEIFLRRKSALSLLNPAEYERQFPKNNAEIAQEIEAAFAILRPAENFARVQRSKTPEQIRHEQEAISQIQNPPRRSQ